MVAENDRQLAEARKQVEKVKTECVDAEERAVIVYKDEFENMFEYMELANCFMMTREEQLVERIGKTHLECDISFLKYAPDDLPIIEGPVSAEVLFAAKPKSPNEAQTTPPIIGKGPECTNH
ncbi:hypothetical protein Adt_27896 [Abeliophyllum distichum]|uniref:Uncharacterized protein n=1 Tax=Abeliophyllum distichum TaxID=126358 RepID=A0ABD1RVC8_9LAMI